MAVTNLDITIARDAIAKIGDPNLKEALEALLNFQVKSVGSITADIINAGTQYNINGSKVLDDTELTFGTTELNQTELTVGTSEINQTELIIGTTELNQTDLTVGTSEINQTELIIGTTELNQTELTLGGTVVNQTKVDIGGAVLNQASVTVGINGPQGASSLDHTGCYIDGTQILSTQQPAIADPAGGATVDTQCRTSLSLLLAACRVHGIIAT